MSEQKEPTPEAAPQAVACQPYSIRAFFSIAKNVLLHPRKTMGEMPLGNGSEVWLSLYFWVSGLLGMAAMIAFRASGHYYRCPDWLPPFLIPVILMFLFGLLVGCFTHLYYKLCGGKGKVGDTLTMFALVLVPGIFGQVPYIGGLAQLYGLYLSILGSARVHAFSEAKATWVNLTPLLILFASVGVFAGPTALNEVIIGMFNPIEPVVSEPKKNVEAPKNTGEVDEGFGFEDPYSTDPNKQPGGEVFEFPSKP